MVSDLTLVGEAAFAMNAALSAYGAIYNNLAFSLGITNYLGRSALPTVRCRNLR